MRKFDMLCVLGRGIEKHSDGIWHPTGMVERLTENNQHSGIPKLHRINDPNEEVVIAGSWLNVMATRIVYLDMFKDLIVFVTDLITSLPTLLVFAGGRPDYLTNEPENISEGRIMYKAFCEGGFSLDSMTQVIFMDKNKNTFDDLFEIMKLAHERGAEKIGIVSVLVHLARCRKILEMIQALCWRMRF